MTSLPRTSRRFAAALLGLALGIALPGAVQADAVLLEASPAADATVTGSPTEIVATFDQELGDDGSSIILRGPDGEDIAEGGLDPEDPTRLRIAQVPALEPGEYEVRYAAASADGHLVRDTWAFTVEAATPAPTATAAATDAASDPPSPSLSVVAPSPSAAPAEPTGSASSTSDILIPIVVLLALVGIGATYFLRRRRPAA